MWINAQDIISRLETYNVETGNRTVILEEEEALFEAPNWSRDGKYLVFNQEGLLYRFDLESKTKIKINTAFATNCNNDHGISPDGKTLVISNTDEKLGSRIYLLPIEGGVPKLITENAPSYWHGWSPDGEQLAYCAERNGNYDVYSISIAGGQEKRLTRSDGLDDGPDYSLSGRYIYFNSVRTGKTQIWRMDSDGSDQTQLSDDGYNDWFPHPSPDGKKIVFISYIDEVDPGSHPMMKRVMLRLMDTESREITKLTELIGGQGTINVPSWSPDSKRFAFVSYESMNNEK
jgi:Tol biopolymer transport system component